MTEKNTKNKNARGSAAQFFVAAELCRRDLVAVVTMGNTPNTDILCSNVEGTKFVHIQVKTYEPGHKKVAVGKKAENNNGKNFIWVLSGIPTAQSHDAFEYYIIPSPVVAKNVKEGNDKWMATLGKDNQPQNETAMRIIELPPKVSNTGWSIAEYKNRWDIIEDLLK
jgi:hypothetical protein